MRSESRPAGTTTSADPVVQRSVSCSGICSEQVGARTRSWHRLNLRPVSLSLALLILATRSSAPFAPGLAGTGEGTIGRRTPWRSYRDVSWLISGRDEAVAGDTIATCGYERV